MRKNQPVMRILAVMAAQLAAGAARADLFISDSLNAYHIYGKDSVRFYGDAKTADGGMIGSDRLVRFALPFNKIGGGITSGGAIYASENTEVAGPVNVRLLLSLYQSSSIFSKPVNVGGIISLTGANPALNQFRDSLYVGGNIIAVTSGWAGNAYAGKTLNGTVTPLTPGLPPELKFGTTKPLPAADMLLPDTAVSYDMAKGCTTPAGTLFNMSLCGLGGNAADTVLAPGRYGNWIVSSGNRLYLASGTYHFRSLTLKSDQTRMIFNQQGTSSTRILIDGDFTVEAGNNLIAPAGYTDPAFNQGRVLIYANGRMQLGDDAVIRATLIAPKGAVQVESGLRLFGQIMGKSVVIENGFNGTGMRGRYLPYKSIVFRYSLMHFSYPD